MALIIGIRFLGAMARALAGLVATFYLVSGAFAADYRLGPGDTIELTVVGLTDFRYKLLVDLNGEIAVPYLPPVMIAGKTLTEARSLLQQALPMKLVRQRTIDGLSSPIVVLPEEVVVSISEYRPVYINGDVSHPGEQPFRPDMTVRKAVALSGGYDIMRFRATNPFLDAADLQAEYNSLITDAAKDQLQIWRIQIQLGQRASFDLNSLPKNKVVNDLAENEKLRLAVLNSDFGKEVDFLKEAARKATAQLSTLTEQQTNEDEGTKADAADYDRLKELMLKGTVPMLRISDARRNVLISSTRWLQTAVQVRQLERDRDDINRKVAHLDDQRRADLLKDLQDASSRLSSTRARIDAVAEKMLYTGIVKSQLIRGKSGKPSVTIYRNGNSGIERIDGNEDSNLSPGDTIEIALTTEFALSIGSR